MIGGLIPFADGPMPDEMRRALVERQNLMEARVTGLAEAAAAQRAPWLRRLGGPPADSGLRDDWIAEVRIVAAYRDRHATDSSSAVGRRFGH